MARDPICFAEVDEVSATNDGFISEFEHKMFFFCSESCKQRFERDPGAFTCLPEWETCDDERSDNYLG